MSAPTRPAWRAHPLAIASLLISTLLSLGALEGSLRVYHRVKLWREWNALPPLPARAMVPSPDPELIFGWNPGWSREGFSVNSLGMADREVRVEKPPGVFRIAFVGDSISANFGHRPRDEIYLNVLGRRLDRDARRGTRFEMLNFGVNAYDLRQSVRRLETDALRFSPDLVVAQLCLNDPYPSPTPYASPPEGPSRLWSFVFRRLAPDRFWAWSYVASRYDEPGIENVTRSIGRLAEIGRSGPAIVAVVFPYLYAPAYDEWGFERYHEVYRRAAREAGLPLLDLYEPFRRAGFIGTQGHPADPIHPGREAHELAADVLRGELDALGLLPGAASDAASAPTRAAGAARATRPGRDR